MSSEKLIALVYTKPEVWDKNHAYYTNKDIKLQAWTFISEKMDLSVEVAKTRWTNLRDLFRRELKKTLKLAKESGDPNAYRPRWKHFQSMLFLKDRMVKDDNNSGSQSVVFDEVSFYPQTILEDGENTIIEGDFYENLSNPGSTPDSRIESLILPESNSKKDKETSDGNNPFSVQMPKKKKKMEVHNSAIVSNEHYVNYSNFYDTDEDYHFVMSILPSVRRIRQERKTIFKKKIFELILEEESLDQQQQ